MKEYFEQPKKPSKTKKTEDQPRKTSLIPPSILGVFTDKNKIYLYLINKNGELHLLESENAEHFRKSEEQLPSKTHRLIQLDSIDKGRFALMTQEKLGLVISYTKDLKKWTRMSLLFKSKEDTTHDAQKTSSTHERFKSGVLIPEYQKDGSYWMILGGDRFRIASSRNGTQWEIDPFHQLNIPVAFNEEVQVDLAKKTPKGIVLCYRLIEKKGSRVHHRAFISLLDLHNLSRILWHSLGPVWETPSEWGSSRFGGAVLYRSQIYSFWSVENLGTVRVRYPIESVPFQVEKDSSLALERAPTNPVIYPRSEFYWESFATYNPAAFHADGKVHILYRAQGSDLISSVGYASSQDGITIDERTETPVYYPQEVFESFQKKSANLVEQQYVSGGGIAGCEDPRVTLIEDRLYMTYVAFDGANPPRAALTSIALDDLLAKRWNWKKPVLISRPGVVDKSAVIFPEKIKDKYVIMHRIFPHIQIDYVDDLDFDGSRWLEEIDRIPALENTWDSRKIGAGAPPLKTSEGWLLIYYGVDDRDDRQYKMGAMLLDLENPAKVLYRSSTPILEPEDWYENSGFKPGIVYPCGAVILNDELLVYYGGADCVVCVAKRNLNSFIQALKANHELKLENQKRLRTEHHAIQTTPIQPHHYA